MKKYLLAICAMIAISGVCSSLVEAKTESLEQVEGDRVVVSKIDRKAKLPKEFLKGNEARAYFGSLGDLKDRVTKNLYTGENVIRHERSFRFGNLSDAVIFNTGGGKIGYLHRRDGAFTVVIDYASGRKLKALDENLFDQYANVINDDCKVPYVFFDKDGKEAAIVFFPSSMTVDQYLTEDGLVVLEVSERI